MLQHALTILRDRAQAPDSGDLPPGVQEHLAKPHEPCSLSATMSATLAVVSPVGR